MPLDDVFAEQKAAVSDAATRDATSASLIGLMLFRVGQEYFAAKMSAVREVIDSVPIVAYPESAARHAGVINLRGSIVPVVEMRPTGDGPPHARLIVFEDLDGHPFGVGVDEVRKTETRCVPQDGHSAMIQLAGKLVRYVSQAQMVALTED